MDTDSLEREKFFQKWDQIAAFKEIVVKKVQAKFGGGAQDASSSTSGSDPPIYG